MKRFPLLVAALVALALALPFAIGSDDAQAQGQPDNTGLARAIEAQERHTDALMARPGVVGTAVGLAPNGGYTVLILTESAAVGGFPATLDSVPARVQVTGLLTASHHRTGHQGGPGFAEPPPQCDVPGSSFNTRINYRPAPIGVSTGHPDITAGTIGARLTDGNGNYWALSNNHVYADENVASIGDAVLQRGAFDGGSSPADDIGTLVDFEPIVFSISASNTIDAAIASVNGGELNPGTPGDGYGLPLTTTTAPVLNACVQKYGRTTGFTGGPITGINANVNIGYSTGVARFVNQIIITGSGFSAGGDSGSLIVSQSDNSPVGLLYAGSSTTTIANPIDLVLARFPGRSIDGGAPPPPDVTAPVISNVSATSVTATSATITWTTDESSDSTVHYGVGDVNEFSDSDGAFVTSHSLTLTGLAPSTSYIYDVESTDGSTNTATASGPGFATPAAAAPGNLSVDSINPNSFSTSTTNATATISGSGFEQGASVIFENGTGPAPSVTVISVTPTSINVTVTVPSGGPPRERVWDLRVTNPGGASDVAQDAFTVTP